MGAACESVYLACLLLERQQLVDGSLWVALRHGVSFAPASCHMQLTAPSFSASGIWASASFEKSFSALSTSPLDMVAGSSCGCYVGC